MRIYDRIEAPQPTFWQLQQEEERHAAAMSIAGIVPPLSNPIAREKDRLSAANSRVLALLQARGSTGATNWELTTKECGGCEGVRRLRELRAHGWDISKTREGQGGTYRYTLKGRRAW